jgi:DNA-binding XRE family transcriptional regulator
MEPSERLDQAMNARRLELRMNWRQVADAAHISYTALRAIRRGDYRPTQLTAQALDAALQWRPGSIDAVLAGGDAEPLSPAASQERESSRPPRQGLSASEALRHATSAFAQKLGLGVEDLEDVFAAVRRDLARAEAARTADPDEAPPYGTPDLSVMVLEARLAAGLSLEDVTRLTAEAPGAPAGLDEGWLSRLENASLTPDEFPEYPQLDALAYALHLDPARVQEAAGVQFRNVHSVWSDDGQSRAMVVGEVSAEDRRKLEALMRMYRRAPKK